MPLLRVTYAKRYVTVFASISPIFRYAYAADAVYYAFFFAAD